MSTYEFVNAHFSPRPISNPLLGETFEIPRLRFISEKVSHHPVVMAYHAEGEGWELYATSAGKTKFWGMWYALLTKGSLSRRCLQAKVWKSFLLV